MAEEEQDSVTFMDLACLFKIAPDTTLERFGALINASIFDAANISGSLKQKGLIDFTAYYPGPNSIAITDRGKALKEEAEAKSASALDELDDEILAQLSGGARIPTELQSTLNLRPKDLALRIYKLSKHMLLSYELKNGNVELMLTEQGFFKARSARAQAVEQVQPAQSVQQQKPAAQPKVQPAQDLTQPEEGSSARKSRRRSLLYVVTLIVVAVALAVVVLYSKGYLAGII
jgi:hypothetical protein